MIGLIKPNWIFSFGGEFNGGKRFCSVLVIFGLRFLPESSHSMQLSHFLWIASGSFDHQKCWSHRRLFMAGCPLCRSVSTVVRRLAGTIIFFPKNTSPYLVDTFRLYWLYSLGMLSYCFLSKYTRVVNSFGSLVLSVISS